MLIDEVSVLLESMQFFPFFTHETQTDVIEIEKEAPLQLE
jgi:hypothetical protein